MEGADHDDEEEEEEEEEEEDDDDDDDDDDDMMMMMLMIIMNKKNKREIVRDRTFIRGTRDNLLFRRFPGFSRSSFAARDKICIC